MKDTLEQHSRARYEKWVNDNFLVELPPFNPVGKPISFGYEAYKAGLAARNEWQPIETAPKGLVLLYWPPTKPSKNHQSNILSAMIRVDHARSTPNRLPTHWMPLPKEPI